MICGDLNNLNKPAGGNGVTPTDPRRILICDDEPVIISLCQSILATALTDCRIDTASNGQEACDLFVDRHHRVIVMDLHMPVMDGQRAYHEINTLCQSRKWEMPHIVFCTGFAPPTVIREIVATDGRHALITKPFLMRMLIDSVATRLS